MEKINSSPNGELALRKAICKPVTVETDYTKEWEFKYFVYIETLGLNTSVKKYCTTIEEVKDFADRYMVDKVEYKGE